MARVSVTVCLGVVLMVLAVVEVGCARASASLRLSGHAADDVLEVADVGGGGGAEGFDAEGEWVVGVHGDAG